MTLLPKNALVAATLAGALVATVASFALATPGLLGGDGGGQPAPAADAGAGTAQAPLGATSTPAPWWLHERERHEGRDWDDGPGEPSEDDR